jgi:hypothetical protein
MKQWPTRDAEADYRRARELLGWWPSGSDYDGSSHHGGTNCRRSGLGGLQLLRSLAADARHPAASWDLHACRHRRASYHHHLLPLHLSCNRLIPASCVLAHTGRGADKAVMTQRRRER